MKLREITRTVAVAGVLSTLFYVPSLHAQFGSFVKSLAGQEAQKVAQDKLDHHDSQTKPQNQNGSDANSTSNGNSQMLQINGAYSFTPGPVTLFQQNFASTPTGSMPPDIKTNGSGQVVTIGSISGHWLELRDGSVYKLAGIANLLQHFTVQFDVIPAARKISDLSGFAFGFAPDNSLRDCGCKPGDEGAINQVWIGYQGWIIVKGNSTGYSHSKYGVSYTGDENQVAHFAITVNGGQMQVWMNHVKIADSRLFRHDPSRYFYLSTGSDSSYGAKLLLSNIRIGGFKPATTTQSTARPLTK